MRRLCRTRTNLSTDLAAYVGAEADNTAARTVPELDITLELLDGSIGFFARFILAPIETTLNACTMRLMQRLVVGSAAGVREVA